MLWRTLAASAATLVVLLAPATASAATATFSGDGLWSDPDQWLPGDPPAPDDTVIIAGNATLDADVVVVPAGIALSIASGGKLLVKGVDEESKIDLGANSSLTVDGLVDIDRAKLLVYGDVSVGSGGSVFVQYDGELSAMAGSFTTSGNLHVAANAKLGAFSNVTITAGALRLDGTMGLGGDVLVTGGALHGSGSVEPSAGKSIVVNGSTARLLGTLTINAPLDVQQGEVGPGDQPATRAVGTIKVFGNVAFAAGTTLTIQITGPSPTDADKLEVTGTATLTGSPALVVDPSAFPNPAVSYGHFPVTATLGRNGTFGTSGTGALQAPKFLRIIQFATLVAVTVGDRPVAPSSIGSTSHAIGVPTSDRTIDITFSGATDGQGIAGYQVSFSPSDTTPSYTGTNLAHAGDPQHLTSGDLSDGAWYVHVWTVDVEGDRTASAPVGPFVIDATGPPTPWIVGAPIGATTSTSATLSVSGHEAVAFQCSFDGAPFAPCADPVTLSGLALGEHSFRALGIDAVGNVGEITTVVWTVVAPPPPPTPNPPTPQPPVKPAAGNIVFSGAAPRFAALGKAGIVKVRLPVGEARLKVTLQLQVNKAQAKALGLKLPRGRSTLVIGTGTVVSKKPGRLIVSVKLTAPAKAAFKRLSARTSRLKSAKVTLRVTLARGKVTSVVNKPLAFKK